MKAVKHKITTSEVFIIQEDDNQTCLDDIPVFNLRGNNRVPVLHGVVYKQEHPGTKVGAHHYQQKQQAPQVGSPLLPLRRYPVTDFHPVEDSDPM